jgi:DNA-binding transcriptional ArsR family regulator
MVRQSSFSRKFEKTPTGKPGTKFRLMVLSLIAGVAGVARFDHDREMSGQQQAMEARGFSDSSSRTGDEGPTATSGAGLAAPSGSCRFHGQPGVKPPGTSSALARDATPVSGMDGKPILAQTNLKIERSRDAYRSKDSQFRHPSRERILDFVAGKPAQNLREICNELRMNRGTATYHLRKLERSNLIRAVPLGRETFYFHVRTPHDQARQLAVLRKGHVRRMAIEILKGNGHSQHGLARSLHLSRGVIRHYGHLLSGARLIRIDRSGYSGKRYEPTAILSEIVTEVETVP